MIIMKHLLKISLCFLVFALIGVLGVKAQGTTQPSLAIYYGGPVGTEYSFVSPMSGVSVTIDDSFVNPCSYKNYLYLGEGVMLNMTVKFPSVFNYSKVKVTVIGGYSETFPVVDHEASIDTYLPMTKGRSIFITQE